MTDVAARAEPVPRVKHAQQMVAAATAAVLRTAQTKTAATTVAVVAAEHVALNKPVTLQQAHASSKAEATVAQ